MTTTNMTIYACTDNCADHCTGQDGWHSLRDITLIVCPWGCCASTECVNNDEPETEYAHECGCNSEDCRDCNPCRDCGTWECECYDNEDDGGAECNSAGDSSPWPCPHCGDLVVVGDICVNCLPF